MNHKSFPDEYSVLSLALSIQMKGKVQMFSVHLDEIQLTAKLFSRSTFVVYGISLDTLDKY